MAVAPDLPDNIRAIIGLELLHRSPATSDSESDASNGGVVRNEHNGTSGDSRKNSNGSDNIRFGNNEVSFERGLNVSYLWINRYPFTTKTSRQEESNANLFN